MQITKMNEMLSLLKSLDMQESKNIETTDLEDQPCFLSYTIENCLSIILMRIRPREEESSPNQIM